MTVFGLVAMSAQVKLVLLILSDVTSQLSVLPLLTIAAVNVGALKLTVIVGLHTATGATLSTTVTAVVQVC